MLLQLLLERLVLRNRRMATTGHSGTDLVRRLRVGQPTLSAATTPTYTIPDRVARQDAGQCLTGRTPANHVGTDDGVISGIAAAQNRRQTQRAVTITTTSAVVVVVVARVVQAAVAEHAADLLSRL